MKKVKKLREPIRYIVIMLIFCTLYGCQAPPGDIFGTSEEKSIIIDNVVALSDIAKDTPDRLQYTFSEPNSGWGIDAQVILPIDLQRFDVIACELGEEPDFDSVLSSSVIPEELRLAEPFEDSETMNYINATMIPTQRRLIFTGGQVERLLFDIECAPGYLHFRQAIPDNYASNVQAIERGVLSMDGIAQNSGIMPEQAVDKAIDFLEALPLPFQYISGQIVAFSPNEETSFSRGFYQIQIKQLIDGKPIAILNGNDQTSWNEKIDSDYIPPVLGSWMEVFDFGIYQANMRWISNSYDVVQKVNGILPLSSAIQIVENFLHALNDPSAEGNYLRASFIMSDQGMEINCIRLEYAATKCENDKVVLSPCWNFENLSCPVTLFRGIRINAVTGEILLVHGG